MNERLDHLTMRELLAQRALLARAIRRRGVSLERETLLARVESEIALRRQNRWANFARGKPHLPDETQ